MPYEQKFIMCDTYAHTIDMSKSSAEGARKYLLYVRFRVIDFMTDRLGCSATGGHLYIDLALLGEVTLAQECDYFRLPSYPMDDFPIDVGGPIKKTKSYKMVNLRYMKIKMVSSRYLSTLSTLSRLLTIFNAYFT